MTEAAPHSHAPRIEAAHGDRSRIGRALARLIRRHRVLIVCGTAASGKSFILQQLAIRALAAERHVHCLRWTRVLSRAQELRGQLTAETLNPRECSDLGPRLGHWLRSAITDWDFDFPESRHLLLVEAPLMRGQFSELAELRNDPAEQILVDPRTKFVLVQPSRPTYHAMELSSDWSRRRPQHNLDIFRLTTGQLSEQWFELIRMGLHANILDLPLDHQLEFEPQTHALVYAHLLRHRKVEELVLDRFVKLRHSVHELGDLVHELLPNEAWLQPNGRN